MRCGAGVAPVAQAAQELLPHFAFVLDTGLACLVGSVHAGLGYPEQFAQVAVIQLTWAIALE